MDTTTIPPTTERMYSSAEACMLADITYRQLDYWCRIGTMTPAVPAKGSGSLRWFTHQQVLVLTVLSLAGGSVRVSQLTELVALLLDWDPDTWDSTTLLVGAGGVWLANERGAPAVATAVRLDAIRAMVTERAATLDT